MAPPLHEVVASGEPPAPADAEVTSILILCCNALPFTRLCLESVFRHTRPPYQLVVVDNASRDGTGAYLEEIRARPGPVRVEVIRNQTNRGFPAGCNQAIARARGRYLVFLNNDTVVTEGWLDGLHGCLRRGGPDAGLVGPLTNYSRPPQHELQSAAATGRRRLHGVGRSAGLRRAPKTGIRRTSAAGDVSDRFLPAGSPRRA